MSDYDDLFAQLEDIEVDEDEIVDVTSMSTDGLMDRQLEIEDILKRKGQLLWPTYQETRDLHSERNAIQVELSKRI